MKAFLFVAILGLSLTTQARSTLAPVLVDQDGNPKCFTSDPQTAIEFLKGMGYDPQLSNFRVMQARCIGSVPFISAQQIDENGELYAEITVPKCRSDRKPAKKCGN